jgi:tetratricopeptide (TPR) repeat protein
MNETFKELFARGHRAQSENDLAGSRAAFIEAVRQAAVEADRPSLAEALCGLAEAERGLGNLEASSHHYANAAVLYRELEQPERLASAIRHQADVLTEASNLVEAEPLYREAEEIYQRPGE